MNEKHHADLAISPAATIDDGSASGHAIPPRGKAWRRAKWAVVLVLLLMALGAVRVVVADYLQRREIADTSVVQAKQYVNVVLPAPSRADGRIVLPGTLRGAVESPIYARASGYLLKRYVNIGSRVEQGALLAELDTPEIDQQLVQALAQRTQTAASLDLAKSSFARWEKLHDRDAVSQQELDERHSAYTQGVANLAAADANVQRLKQLESFKRIVAPFAGVITQRNVDVGDLVDAGGGGNRALFSMAQTDTLRVYAQIPQAYAQGVADGQQVTISQAELPGQHFTGTIAHVAGAIDVATRSLQVEIRLANPGNLLRPGSYVQVALQSQARAEYIVPGNTLLFRAQGPQVAVVGDDSRVHLRSVTIAQDLGLSLALTDGVGPKDRLILNPNDAIAEGDTVDVVPAAQVAPALPPASAPGA